MAKINGRKAKGKKPHSIHFAIRNSLFALNPGIARG